MSNPPSPRGSGDKLANYLTMVGHACTDINQGALSAVLPFLMIYSDYTYTQVTLLVFAANITSAVIQPLFGWIGDRRACPWFMALGSFLAGLGMAAIGFAGNYLLVLLASMVSGIGVAMFHPEGGRLANLAAGKLKANGMSIFAVGGNVGFFVGPIMTATFLTAFGMHGTLVFLIPTTICSLVLLFNNKRFAALGIAKAASTDVLGTREYWGKFWLVMGVLTIRAIVTGSLVTFIPLFILNHLGQSESVSSLVLSLNAVAGAVATVMSGRVSQRVNVHWLMIGCFSVVAVLIVVFANNTVVAAAMVLSMMLSIANSLFYPATVALGMSYVPKHLGTASGLSYGVAVCMGGIAQPFLGMAGDSVGLVPVMMALAGFAVAGALLSIVLKKVHKAD